MYETLNFVDYLKLLKCWATRCSFSASTPPNLTAHDTPPSTETFLEKRRCRHAKTLPLRCGPKRLLAKCAIDR